jgi:HAD superfamily hydrolase (TIGR01509 family)
MTPAAVLLDCDGVLIDSELPAFELLSQDFTAHGLPVTPDDIGTRWMGMTVHGLHATARAAGATLPDDWPADFYERLYAVLALGVPLIDGIEDVLDRLDAAGIPYAVGSNGSLRKMDITLRPHTRLWRRLEGRVFSGQDLRMPKPDPGLWRHCAAVLGVPDSACAVVDDAAPGCIGAQAAGMRAFGFAAHGDGAQLAKTGATVFHRMADLPGLVGL